ncbi:hypothetical protein EGM88_13960 [Aureibaculum marinum]|uniref:Restriction endonuclease n=1 Tax=Aureibaculum marinum TaxID=2487930 RepID=A0A3N4NA46_9FLAO|nr:hypothetical protein [Aureibaculum marinum]RPD93051.1 hypothetical protein EGM88_13960 [Aureibaculum marinum]
MIEQLNEHFANFDFDVRKSKDARFMDQKVTPDVLCIMADCVLNYTADRDIEFTKDDIWNDSYFNTNVKAIFNKPDAKNETTRQEYDKFTSQPLRTLAYSGVLAMRKDGNKNLYHITNKPILEFIAMKERNAYLFLYHYLIKVLSDSNELRYFEEFKSKCINGSVDNADFQDLKTRFQRFIIGNTAINGTTEVNRIFPKILNVYACQNNIQGTVKGRLSANQFYYTDLMYNRPNWRDVGKNKNVSRNEAVEEHETLMMAQNEAYSDYQVQKAMNMIRKMYKESEIKDQWANGEATQIHHIFPKSEFPQLAHYLENLIKLTPTQHYAKAHPSNKTDAINKDYQLVCLLAKSDNIENSLRKGEYIYRKESFVYVINTGLSETLEIDLDFIDIKRELSRIYNEA